MNPFFRPLLRTHPEIKGKNLECINHLRTYRSTSSYNEYKYSNTLSSRKTYNQKKIRSTVTSFSEEQNAKAEYISALSYPEVMPLIRRLDEKSA